MSAFAGFIDRHLHEDAAVRLAQMARAIVPYGPDGLEKLQLGRVAMAFASFHVTGDSRRVTQPYRDSGRVIAWDGRLDNRAELEALDSSLERGLPDAVLLARLHARLGDAVIARLVGDFAFAMWQEREQRLVLARDAAGSRPLFYRQDPNRFSWASSIGALVESPAAVDDGWLAAYLMRLTPLETTPYRGIRQVPAGAMLILENGGEPDGQLQTRIESFWRYGEQSEIRYKSDAEYEEHFRELFYDAVRARMRTGGVPICCELSGGLDSSSVACVAHDILQNESVEASDVLTYSIVYDRASTADEREYIVEVEKRLGKPGIHLLEDEHPNIMPGFEKPWSDVPNFLQTLRAPFHEAARRLAETGTRMVMTGAGGDQLMWNDIEAPFYLADLARAGRLGELWRELGRWRRRPARSQYPQPLPQLVVRGVLRPLVWSLAGRSTPAVPMGSFPHLDPGLDALQREAWTTDNPRMRGIRPSLLPPIGELRDTTAHISWFYHFERIGYQMSHPFLHRPLVEFCLGIPNEQFVRVDETRSLQRRALRHVLPPKVAQRYGKVGPDEAILRGLRREWSTIESLLDGARVCERGLARPEPLRQALQRARGGYASCNMDLVRLLEVEIWLRGLESSRPQSLAA